jgi:hypothetical protein
MFSFLKYVCAAAVCMLLVTNSSQSAFAQAAQSAGTMGVARMIDVIDKNVKDGSILSNSDHGTKLSTMPYDPQVIGIVSQDAGILFDSGSSKNSYPVVSQGKVYILVSAKNGTIKKGDLITTSTIPGVAVKADADGYVLGTALEEYKNTNPQKAEQIAVELNLHYFNAKPTLLGSLTDILKFALLPSKDSPTPIFKYIVAAAVVLASIVLGFLTFGRTAAKGVEALGRNPAASKIIHLGIMLNITIVIVIVLAGLTVAFLILRL